VTHHFRISAVRAVSDTGRSSRILNRTIHALSLTLSEDHRLRVFENRVLRGIFGPKRDEVSRERRKLYKEELHNYTHHQISLGR
jgi:hypothetical protein